MQIHSEDKSTCLKNKKSISVTLKLERKKHVANMTDREKRSARKKWRNYKRSAAVKEKEFKTPSKSNTCTRPETSGSHVLVSRQQFQSLKTSSNEKKLLKEENKVEGRNSSFEKKMHET